MNTLSDLELQELTSLAHKLAHYELEEHFIEIAVQIWGPHSAVLREDFINIKTWTNDDVCSWFTGLSFLKQDASKILSTLYEECIDGEFLYTMNHNSWINKLGLSYRVFILIEIIFQGWSCGLKSLQLPSDIEQLGKFMSFLFHLCLLDVSRSPNEYCSRFEFA